MFFHLRLSLSAALFCAICRRFVLCFPLFYVVRFLVCFSMFGLVVVRLVLCCVSISLSLSDTCLSRPLLSSIYSSLCVAVSDRTLFGLEMICTCARVCLCAHAQVQMDRYEDRHISRNTIEHTVNTETCKKVRTEKTREDKHMGMNPQKCATVDVRGNICDFTAFSSSYFWTLCTSIFASAVQQCRYHDHFV